MHTNRHDVHAQPFGQACTQALLPDSQVNDSISARCVILVTGVADPFAMSGGGPSQGAPPSSPPAGAGGAEPVRPIGDINDWFRKLCQSPAGVLYEDNYLQARHPSCFLS